MPKNVSFHLGLNVYGPQAYRVAADLQSADHDARAMYNLAVTLGYTAFDLQPRAQWDGTASAPPNVKINEEADYATVVDLFTRAATLPLDAGDSCLITFSGHGTQIRLPPPPVPDPKEGKLNEAACLFDFPLIDDVTVGLLTKFNPGVDVFLVLDCCHAGAKASDILKDQITLIELDTARRTRRRPGLGKVKFAVTKHPLPTSQLAAQLLAEYRGIDRKLIKANVAVFQACKDFQVTFDGEKPTDLSLYSGKFINGVGNGMSTVSTVASVITNEPPPVDNCDPRFQHTDDQAFLAKPMKR